MNATAETESPASTTVFNTEHESTELGQTLNDINAIRQELCALAASTVFGSAGVAGLKTLQHRFAKLNQRVQALTVRDFWHWRFANEGQDPSQIPDHFTPVPQYLKPGGADPHFQAILAQVSAQLSPGLTLCTEILPTGFVRLVGVHSTGERQLLTHRDYLVERYTYDHYLKTFGDALVQVDELSGHLGQLVGEMQYGLRDMSPILRNSIAVAASGVTPLRTMWFWVVDRNGVDRKYRRFTINFETPDPSNLVPAMAKAIEDVLEFLNKHYLDRNYTTLS
jgi:hypothetical protein